MNHCVPDFEMDDEFPIPTSSSSTITTQKAEDDIMELIWQEGMVVVHSQTQSSLHKSPPSETPAEPPPPQPPPLPPPPQNTQLYMAEDEMSTWLHYPFEDLYADLLYPTSTPQPPITLTQLTAASVRAPEVRQSPPQPPPWLRPPVTMQSAARNFQILSTLRGRATEASSSRTGLTLVDSYDTPSPVPDSGPPDVAVSRGDPSGDGGGASLSRGGGSGDMTATSSPSASGSGYAATETATGTAVDDRKRKGRETDDATATTTECQTERRRDRINEKMKALQELIPRCNKSDKASMLDEAIEYLKSLQMQVQMMSMGCGMVPMMYPGIQQPYMPPMGMGMGMGMGMDIGMTRAMMPFPSTVGGSALPTSPAGPVIPTSQAAAAAPQLGQRLPAPAFPMLPFQAPGLSVLQPINQEDPIRSSYPMQSSGLPQFPNAGDPYQHYLALQQMQMQALQNQSLSQPGSSKPSTSKSEDDYNHNQCGQYWVSRVGYVQVRVRFGLTSFGQALKLGSFRSDQFRQVEMLGRENTEGHCL